MELQKYLKESIKENDTNKEWKSIFIKAFNESTPKHFIYSDKILRYNEIEEDFIEIEPNELLKFLLDILENNISIGYKEDLLKKIVVEEVLSKIKENTVKEMISIIESYSLK